MSTFRNQNSLEARLGRRVKELRQKCGLSQKELAEKLAKRLKKRYDDDDREGSWYQPDISDLERGERWPRTDVIEALAKAFRVPVEKLLFIPTDDPVEKQLNGRSGK